MTFPSSTGNEELLCEIHRFLMSCRLSPLLTNVHPAINCFGTSVTLLMSENQNVDQKWGFFPQKLHLANGIFLKSISRKPAGNGIIHQGTMLGKEAPQGHLMGRMGNNTGEFLG